MDAKRDVTMVIFGAGASYDCLTSLSAGERRDVEGQIPLWPGQPVPFKTNVEETRPPLTKMLSAPGQLRDQTLLPYSDAAPILALLRDLPGLPNETFEDKLVRVLERFRRDPHLDRKVLALKFYLRDLMLRCARFIRSDICGGVANAYHTLVAELYNQALDTDSHLCLVTFNYDPLLDHVCSDMADLDMSHPDSLVANEHISLLRPHGSALWVYENTYGDVRQTSTSLRRAADQTRARSLFSTEGAIVAINGPWWEEDNELDYRPGEARFPIGAPAIALPLAGKSAFAWPDSHATHFDDVRNNIRRLMTVGWHAGEQHFTPKLNYGPAAERGLVVVGNDPSKREAAGVYSRVPRLGQRTNFHTSGFATLFQSAHWYQFNE